MEVRRLRLFEDKALIRIFGPKTDEVTGPQGSTICGSIKQCSDNPIKEATNFYKRIRIKVSDIRSIKIII